ncbi:MAG TPA: hypothetical protein VF458_19375, partial [Ktedonobacteraceae bacterium]
MYIYDNTGASMIYSSFDIVGKSSSGLLSTCGASSRVGYQSSQTLQKFVKAPHPLFSQGVL